MFPKIVLRPQKILKNDYNDHFSTFLHFFSTYYRLKMKYYHLIFLYGEYTRSKTTSENLMVFLYFHISFMAKKIEENDPKLSSLDIFVFSSCTFSGLKMKYLRFFSAKNMHEVERLKKWMVF